MTNFKEQIKSPKWQKRRLEILQRDDFTCQMCGDKDKTLHVHHLYYDNEKEYWEYEDLNLITLCEDCHSEEHDCDKESINDSLTFLRKCGLTSIEINALLDSIYFDIIHGKTPVVDITKGIRLDKDNGDDKSLERLEARRVQIIRAIRAKHLSNKEPF